MTSPEGGTFSHRLEGAEVGQLVEFPPPRELGLSRPAEADVTNLQPDVEVTLAEARTDRGTSSRRQQWIDRLRSGATQLNSLDLALKPERFLNFATRLIADHAHPAEREEAAKVLGESILTVLPEDRHALHLTDLATWLIERGYVPDRVIGMIDDTIYSNLDPVELRADCYGRLAQAFMAAGQLRKAYDETKLMVPSRPRSPMDRVSTESKLAARRQQLEQFLTLSGHAYRTKDERWLLLAEKSATAAADNLRQLPKEEWDEKFAYERIVGHLLRFADRRVVASLVLEHRQPLMRAWGLAQIARHDQRTSGEGQSRIDTAILEFDQPHRLLAAGEDADRLVQIIGEIGLCLASIDRGRDYMARVADEVVTWAHGRQPETYSAARRNLTSFRTKLTTGQFPSPSHKQPLLLLRRDMAKELGL